MLGGIVGKQEDPGSRRSRGEGGVHRRRRGRRLGALQMIIDPICPDLGLVVGHLTPSVLDPLLAIYAAEGEGEGADQEGAGDAEEEADARG